MIESVIQPFGIVSVAGMYRTGKSYLLNRVLLDRSDGFGVGPTINPCTKGLWIWGRPLDGTTSDGTPIKVLVIDTEGLGAFDETQNHDVRVFSLAILLSSFFVYNSMGTIDENALQQLSLVVNLTKNIQLSSDASQQDDNALAAIFPSFIWIVRDFSLQLIDQNQQQITPKEYFERALLDQKGDSESIVQKNKIRSHLRTFFKVRDCQTMIRPLANEKQLQSLSKLKLESLRPEFVAQVKTVREKILNNVKVKELNGQVLNGHMLVELARQYVAAINNGSVPNIENAWSFICKMENNKAFQQSIEAFEQLLKTCKLPRSDQHIKSFINEAQLETLKLFDKLLLSQECAELKINFQNHLQKQSHQFKQQNTNEFRSVIAKFAQSCYSRVNKGLREGTFENLKQFYDAVEEVRAQLVEECPSGPQAAKDFFIEGFICNQVKKGCQLLLESQRSESCYQLSLANSQLSDLNTQLIQIKAEEKEINEKLKESLLQTQMKANETEMAKIVIEKQFNLYKEDQEVQRIKIFEYNEATFKTLNGQVQTFKDLVQSKDELIGECQKQIMILKSDHDKAQALANQRCVFLQDQITYKQQSEQLLQSEMHQLILQHDEQMKELSTQYNQQEKEFNDVKKTMNEQIHDASVEKMNLEQEFAQDKLIWSQKEKELCLRVDKLVKEVSDTSDVMQKQAEVDQLQQDLNELKETLQQCISKSTQELTALKDEKDSLLLKHDKETALICQKLEFKNQQLKDVTKTLADKQLNHKNFVTAMETQTLQLQEASEQQASKLQQVKEDYILQVQRMCTDFDQQKQSFEQQIECFKEIEQKSEMVNKALIQKQLQEIQGLTQSVAEVEAKNQSLEKCIKSMEDQHFLKLEEANEKSQILVNKLTQELEQVSESSNFQLADLKQTAEEQLSKLKNFFAMEKERIEARSIEERAFQKKQFSEMQNDFEFRINEESARHSEFISDLNDQLQYSSQIAKTLQQQLDHSNQMWKQKLDTLEEYLRDKDSRLKLEQEQHLQALDQIQDKFQAEKKEYAGKLESLQIMMGQKEKDINGLMSQINAINDEVAKKDKVINQRTESWNLEKAKFEEKIQQMKLYVQQSSERDLIQKHKDCQQIALLQQRNDFMQTTIDELKLSLDLQTSQFADQSKQLKFQAQTESDDQVQRFNEQKKSIEKRFDTKLKSLKESESANIRKVSELQRELALVQQKLIDVTSGFKSDADSKINEIHKLKQQAALVQEQLAEEIDKLQQELVLKKSQLFELEKENMDLESQFERQKLLFEGKVQFLEQQRDQAKQDLNESSKKFESTLESIQKRWLERERQETNQNVIKQGFEQNQSRYLKEKSDELNQSIAERDDKLREVERLNRELQTQVQIQERDLITSQRQFDKKVQEFAEREQELKKNYDFGLSDQKSKIEALAMMLAKEKETFKNKIFDIEHKNKEIENRRSALLFNFEKERATWNMENEKLKARNSELQERIEGVERRSNTLLRDNEKLKNNQRMHSKSFISNGSLTARSSISASGALTSRTDGATSTIKLQFGQRLSTMHGQTFTDSAVSIANPFKENISEHVFIAPSKEEYKQVVRSTLINVTAPFRQKENNLLSARSSQPMLRPTIIKRLNLTIATQQKLDQD